MIKKNQNKLFTIITISIAPRFTSEPQVITNSDTVGGLQRIEGCSFSPVIKGAPVTFSYLRNGYKTLYPLSLRDNNNSSENQEVQTTISSKLGDGFPPLIFDNPQYIDQGYYQCMLEIEGMAMIRGARQILSPRIDVQFTGI